MTRKEPQRSWLVEKNGANQYARARILKGTWMRSQTRRNIPLQYTLDYLLAGEDHSKNVKMLMC